MAEAQRGDAEAYRALLNDIGPEVMGYLRSRVPKPAGGGGPLPGDLPPPPPGAPTARLGSSAARVP